MTLAQDREMAHALAVRARGSALPPEGAPGAQILDSWVRCMRAGLDGAATMAVPVVEGGDLARRREHADFMRRLARAELETLSQQIAGSNFLLAFADRDGVILDIYCDNRFSMSSSDAAIVAGSRWSEELCGTNGLGTALAVGSPVAVTGLEHYYLQLGDISCTAAPVRDPLGNIVGVLDASSYFESRQRHTLALVQMAATHIENGLLAHQMRSHLVLALHPRSEFLDTLSAGLLAFDGEGRLLGLNGRGSQLLSGLDAVPGTAFETLFAEPFEQFCARLHQRDEVRLRDVLGSSLVARWAGGPGVHRGGPVVSPPFVPSSAPSSATRASPAIASEPVPSLPPLAGASIGPRRVPARTPWELSSAESFTWARAALSPAFLADDPSVAEACRLVESAVRLRAPILICGETGSGKELLAGHAHKVSGRTGAFVPVNCGALPSELFEAELFGHVGGAFTGARRGGNLGLIASAHGGTLLLDELGELPLPLQAGLLRFVDDQLVRPVGGTTARQVDVQLLAATHADLDLLVATGRFRADLLHRLNTVRVELPPVRLRRDFEAIVRTVLASIDPGASIDPEGVTRLSRHAWPGNFRELKSLLTRALLLADGRRRLTAEDIRPLLPAAAATPASALQQSASEIVRREFERSGGSVSRTARELGVSRTTVYRHLRELGLHRA